MTMANSSLCILVVLAIATAVSGCGRHAVRASEKAFLADPIMVFDSDPQETSTNEHVRSNREGAAGGNGAGGGGCGCN
jgi:hypothetical protein